MKKINYLTIILASTVLLGVMLFGEIYRSYPPFLILTVITFGLSLVSLFLIRKKNLQVRLLVYNSIVLLAYQGWIIWLFWKIKHTSGLTMDKFPVSVVFPVICVILNIIAISMLRKSIAAEDFMKLMQKMQGSKKDKSKK